MIDWKIFDTTMRPDVEPAVDFLNRILRSAGLKWQRNHYTGDIIEDPVSSVSKYNKLYIGKYIRTPLHLLVIDNLYPATMRRYARELGNDAFFNFYSAVLDEYHWLPANIKPKVKYFLNIAFGCANNKDSLLQCRPDLRNFITSKARELLLQLYDHGGIYAHTDTVIFGEDFKAPVVNHLGDYRYTLTKHTDGIIIGPRQYILGINADKMQWKEHTR